jgi:hypothetical protein
MAALKTAKYVREAPAVKSLRPKEVPSAIPTITSDENYGNLGFHMYTQMVKAACTIAAEPHKHDFTQYLFFFGGDADDLINLGGVIEMSLGEDVKTMEKHVITKATTLYIPAGLYHCPLVFKKVTRPIALTDLFFSQKYERK